MIIKDLQGQGSRERKPYANVILNDSDVLTGLIEAEVSNNSHFAADTFRLTFALSGLPQDLNETYWSDSQEDKVEIFMGLKDAEAQQDSMIYGQVDEIDVDPVGRTLTLTGRDLSGLLIDAKTAERFADQPSSEIVKTIAARHDLQADVTDTKKWTGKYYEQLHARLNQDQTEWDLLIFLAQQEQFDVWVTGKTVNFHPPVEETSDPYVLMWSDQGGGNRVANFERLTLRRNQTIARDVIVKVRSWNQSGEAVITAEAKATKPEKGQRKGGMAQQYVFNVPNLTKDQADKWAKAKADEITKHERVIVATLPGDNLLTNRSLIRLVGTNTSWDQNYYVDSVSRHVSFERGYTMEVRAKNHSTESMVEI